MPLRSKMRYERPAILFRFITLTVVTESWRQLWRHSVLHLHINKDVTCNEDLRDLSTSPNTVTVIKSRRRRWVGHAARMGENMNAKKKALVGKPEGRRPLWPSSHEREDNIKMGIKNRNGWRRLDLSGSEQGFVVGCCENLWIFEFHKCGIFFCA